MLVLASCASLPPHSADKPKTTGLTADATSRLGQIFAPLTEQHPDQSGFQLLHKGMAAIIARLGLIGAADVSIDVQYYIWHEDVTGAALTQALLDAEDRGVRVRALLDDLDIKRDSTVAALDSHPNIDVRLFNPFVHRATRGVDFLTATSRVNRRMHNKSLTVDGMATIVGGRNIGNEYFEAVAGANFADLDVLGIGPVVKDVARQFDTYWNSSVVFSLTELGFQSADAEGDLENLRAKLKAVMSEVMNSPYAEALREVRYAKYRSSGDPVWAKAEVIYDAPEKILAKKPSQDTHMVFALGALMNSAEKELNIISPYFVPGEKFVEQVAKRVSDGIRVRILTNSFAATDVSMVHAGYAKYRFDLLKAGAELYEYKPTATASKSHTQAKLGGSSRASLHAKTFGVDDKTLFVGSFNLDPRSARLNTEMGIAIHSAEYAKQISNAFAQQVATEAYRLELVQLPENPQDPGFTREVIVWSTVENGEEIRFDTEPHMGFWKRFWVGFLRMLPIEGQL